MFDRIGLIRALNSILGLMFDGFCQACSRLAIYRKMRKNSLSAQFSVERYIVLIHLISKSFSSSSRLHHQVVLIIKSFSSSSCSHHQVVSIKTFSSRRLHQVVLIKSFSSSSSAHHQVILSSDRSKSIYQVNLSSQSIKSIYQVNLSSHLIKPSYQVVASTQKRS
jgi:hypothetical protein